MADTHDVRQDLIDCASHALVLGGPGSGKTTLALKKAATRVRQGLSSGQSVLFLSFSRAAVARIAEASKTADTRENRRFLNMQTFHSFCWEFLRVHAYLLGVPKRLHILLPQDERALSEGLRGDTDEEAWRRWLLERERLFHEEGRVAFDLFAPAAAALLGKSTLLRNLLAQRYPLIIVDEAQDTGPDAWRCIELLAPLTQVICLADLEQQIFDYLPGIGPERIEAIKDVLKPKEVDLGADNHRSPNSEILVFGRDILSGRARGAPYEGVSVIHYHPKTDMSKLMRMAVGALQRRIRKATGKWGRSTAILVPSGAEAARISAALNSGEKPVKHKLLFDESEALLSARFAAFLLEPKSPDELTVDVARALELLADIKRANGSTKAADILAWANKIRSGKMPRAGLVTAIQSLITQTAKSGFVGDPVKDWQMVKRALRTTKDAEMERVAGHLDYLVAFNRGKHISANLAECWRTFGTYVGARAALDSALAYDQLLDGIDDPPGLQVMTIHKLKGKQFDGVIIKRSGRHDGTKLVSTFLWWGDTEPYRRSRKILRVAITRAKTHTLLVDPFWPDCPILGPHKL